MKRVLIITRNYPPLWGGMERLNLHLLDELKKRYDVVLVGPKGAEQYSPDGVEVVGITLKPLPVFLFFAVIVGCLKARSLRPDYILAGSGLTALPIWIASKFCKAKTIVYAHGLDVVVDSLLYRLIWHPILRKVDLVLANSNPTETLLEKCARVDVRRIAVLNPGVEIPDPIVVESDARRNERKRRFCDEHSIEFGPLLLSVGRLVERKGLREFVRDVMPRILRENSDVKLVVIGKAPDNSLYAKGQSVENIRLEAEEAGVGENLYFLGWVSDKDLIDAYCAADVHVFPVQDTPNDPEGFGMVAIEAAAYGLPTIAYATGGIVDAVKDGVSGRLIQSGDSSSFANSVVDCLSSPLDADLMRSFAAEFSWAKFGDRLDRLLKNITTSNAR